MSGLIPLLLAAGGTAALDLTDGLKFVPTGFVDVGWFDVGGDGASYARDAGNQLLETDPDGAAWVYWGDPWAAAINSQGDPADLGADFNTLQRTDPVSSGGRPTFLVNTVEQGFRITAGRQLAVRGALWVEPRSGQLGALGDVVSLDRAYLDFEPVRTADLRVAVGKVPSAFGIEYRTRLAPHRPGITPSLMGRYTIGTPVGIRAMGSAFQRTLWITGSVTNGSTTTERFGHVADELDSNGIPTGTLRVGVRHEGAWTAELGASGMAGAQDGQPDPIPMFQVGGDLRLRVEEVRVRVEYLLTDQDQGDPAEVDTLRAHGGYAEVQVQLNPWLAPLIRVDRRDALLRAGDNLYDSDVLRLTAGARFDVSRNLLVKVEGMHLRELVGPQLADDVITSSVVFHY